MWWEWVIVFILVGVAGGWLIRRAYRRLTGRAGPSCTTCAKPAVRSLPEAVQLQVETRSDARRTSD